MKEIRDYVEVMFKDFPKTKEAVDMKLNILDTMETKYNDLIAEGKNKHEAVGIVIGQFGNVDELRNEFGVEQSEIKGVLPTDELKEYLKFKKHFGKMIAIGTTLIIMSIGLMTFFTDSKFENLAVFLMFIPIGIAVLLFVLNGLRYSKYDYIEKGTYSLHNHDMVWLKSEYDIFSPKFNMAIAVGVFLCIMGAMSVILTEEVLKLGENSYGLTLFPLVSIGVYLFISFGTQKSAYTILFDESSRCKEEEPLEWLYGLTMPFATIVFLLIGFVADIWHPTWIIFPTMVFLTEATRAIYKHTKNK